MKANLIENSLLKANNYNTYRAIVKKLIAEEKATGPHSTVDLLRYSILNDKRMDRLDKKIALPEETKNSLSQLEKNYTFLVISEGWCGDAAQILPIINKISEESSQIDLKIVLRDENEDLMNQFLTNGAKAIPKVIILDEKNEIINSWGPRPSIATKMVTEYKEKNGSIDAEFKKDLQVWYNKDKGISTQQDILTILKAS